MARAENSLKITELSVFLPCFNEEKNIENTTLATVKVLESLNLKYEVIIVDDGSSDKSGEISDKLAKLNSNIRVIHHEKNLGYGVALRTGFASAKYEWIVFTDSDGQFDFSEITKLIDKTDQAPVVVGYRMDRQDPWFRKLFGWGWTFLANLFLGVNVRDVDCAFKLIKKDIIRKMPTLESSRGGMISPELLAKARRVGADIAEVGVHHYPRIYGEQTGANIKVILKSFKELFKLWWKLRDNKWAFLVIIGILLLAAFLRFYKLDQYMNFLGDEGRDALMIRRIWTQFDLPLIGPASSVGNIYLGPLYYYMMAIPMLIFWMNPVAAAAMVALIGVLTVGLIYYLTREWFGEIPGLVSSFLYAISPITIIYSRSSWNPNPAPFFTLLAVWGFYKAHQSKNYLWFVVTGIFTAAALQMHYLTLLLIPLWGILWCIEISKKAKKNFFKGTMFGLLAFFTLMSPIVIFDLNPGHQFVNFKGFLQIFSGDGGVSTNLISNVTKIIPIFTESLIGRYIAGENLWAAYLVALLLFLPLILYRSWVILLCYCWLLVGVIGVSFYQGQVYDHYLGFISPVVYILFGASLTNVIKLSSKVKLLGLFSISILLVWVTYLNLAKNPLQYPPNNQLKRTQDIVKYIINESNGQPFNLGMIAERNYDAGYRFFLSVYGHPPEETAFKVTDSLFVVCEDKVCEPVTNSKDEIARFGWSMIDRETSYEGVKIYKLVHNPAQQR